mmetsp:Transcript_83582/g.215261  ORF Transcript_83582/g.215261 Transcript_83582/m.215261 type:complete len:125 (+) Transcript_83582:599-973(+)
MLLVLRIDLIDDGVERATPRCRTSQESVGHAAVYGRGTLAGLTLPSERFESAQHRARAAFMLVKPRCLASGAAFLLMGSSGDALCDITGHEGDPRKERAIGCISSARFLASTSARIACHQRGPW